MDIIKRYRQYMLNRSLCTNVQLVYESPGYMPNSRDYYTLVRDSENLFFVIKIGDSEVLYYWKKPIKIDGMDILFNRYTEDCEYITEYDEASCINERIKKIELINRIKQKGTQTGVFIQGCSQTMPEPFTYDELELTSFPDTMTRSYTSINISMKELFHAESMMEDGIMNNMTITETGSMLNIGGIVTRFNCTLYVFKAFN